MKKDGNVAKYDHHGMSELSDGHKHQNNDAGHHKKGGHVEQHGGKVQHVSDDGNGFHHHPVHGKHHHLGNLTPQGPLGHDGSGGYLQGHHKHGHSEGQQGASPRADLNTAGGGNK